MSWELVYTKHVQKDAQKLADDLAGAYSKRINIQHRLVYEVLHEENVVKVLRMWSHYE